MWQNCCCLLFALCSFALHKQTLILRFQSREKFGLFGNIELVTKIPRMKSSSWIPNESNNIDDDVDDDVEMDSFSGGNFALLSRYLQP